MRLAEDHIKALLERMSVLVFKQNLYPDAAFARVANESFISRGPRKYLKKRWKMTETFKNWVRTHPKETEHFTWIE